jgi:hypothetical protein
MVAESGCFFNNHSGILDPRRLFCCNKGKVHRRCTLEIQGEVDKRKGTDKGKGNDGQQKQE